MAPLSLDSFFLVLPWASSFYPTGYASSSQSKSCRLDSKASSQHNFLCNLSDSTNTGTQIDLQPCHSWTYTGVCSVANTSAVCSFGTCLEILWGNRCSGLSISRTSLAANVWNFLPSCRFGRLQNVGIKGKWGQKWTFFRVLRRFLRFFWHFFLLFWLYRFCLTTYCTLLLSIKSRIYSLTSSSEYESSFP